MLDIEKKLGTKVWNMRVNISILSIVIVDIWCVVKGILGDGYNSTEDTFYTKLVEKMVENSLDTPQTTRIRTYLLGVITGPPSTLDTSDGRVSDGIGVQFCNNRA